jgi:hypothetical protein
MPCMQSILQVQHVLCTFCMQKSCWLVCQDSTLACLQDTSCPCCRTHAAVPQHASGGLHCTPEDVLQLVVPQHAHCMYAWQDACHEHCRRDSQRHAACMHSSMHRQSAQRLFLAREPVCLDLDVCAVCGVACALMLPEAHTLSWPHMLCSGQQHLRHAAGGLFWSCCSRDCSWFVGFACLCPLLCSAALLARKRVCCVSYYRPACCVVPQNHRLA